MRMKYTSKNAIHYYWHSLRLRSSNDSLAMTNNSKSIVIHRMLSKRTSREKELRSNSFNITLQRRILNPVRHLKWSHSFNPQILNPSSVTGSFYTSFGSLMFSEGIERDQWCEMG